MREIKTMTKEQKEELVKMDWREVIIKRKQMRDKTRQKPQTRMSGGSPDDAKRMRMGRKDSLDNVFEEEMDDLAEMTRGDLYEVAIRKLNNMSKEELIKILEMTQGNLMEAKI